ncbi:hypothetical protein DLM45_05950 [Hyphomicrobium methylovorum]|nr:hypothetical protein [Hyphomicrobium methylovorum]
MSEACVLDEGRNGNNHWQEPEPTAEMGVSAQPEARSLQNSTVFAGSLLVQKDEKLPKQKLLLRILQRAVTLRISIAIVRERTLWMEYLAGTGRNGP